MSAARFFTSRLPIRAAFRGHQVRLNSSAATSPAARLAEIARTAEKPSALEASVPVMWAVSGALIYTAWNRIDEKKEDHVEKLLIV
ncbi:hypothetical protein BU24DRAFT_493569 [Aaosphaeria arxii CBS 175.79]|uniref:Uncharacterized protein n=1 Tax=Aaosphaeria arxii CBS 175.79 TaxID=1450172 RepID=A0A6A5XQC9_9PLEO|nr:uncharacterized protein BU24DRAFT_493569 [Aaosphaeria arxii CBS 175.79]KAF2015106.1 hypothetical protein BU24DRAFT_493569 [Aaosphaeria arxii CBS 175.79]